MQFLYAFLACFGALAVLSAIMTILGIGQVLREIPWGVLEGPLRRNLYTLAVVIYDLAKIFFWLCVIIEVILVVIRFFG